MGAPCVLAAHSPSTPRRRSVILKRVLRTRFYALTRARLCSTLLAVRILVTGGAGMVGRKLAQRLARDGAIGGEPIAHLVARRRRGAGAAADAAFDVETVVADLAEPGVAGDLVSEPSRRRLPPRGRRLRRGGGRLRAGVPRQPGRDAVPARRDPHDGSTGYRPRVVFASSIAVFGAPFPDVIGDDSPPDAADELRDAEGDRRAAAVRLHAGAASSTASASACRPSVSGRAQPNRAASGFFSSIIREPLNGRGGGAAGARRRSSLARLAARGGRLPRSMPRRSTAARSATAAA